MLLTLSNSILDDQLFFDFTGEPVHSLVLIKEIIILTMSNSIVNC